MIKVQWNKTKQAGLPGINQGDEGKKTPRELIEERFTGTGQTSEQKLATKGAQEILRNLVGETRFQEAVKEARNNEGETTPPVQYKRPKGLKRKRKSKSRVVGYKEVVIDGKKVQVKVLQDGNEYYVGKSVPSGLVPRGTRDTERQHELRQIRKLGKYIQGRYDAADQFENERKRPRKGGTADAWLTTMENWNHEYGETIKEEDEKEQDQYDKRTTRREAEKQGNKEVKKGKVARKIRVR